MNIAGSLLVCVLTWPSPQAPSAPTPDEAPTQVAVKGRVITFDGAPIAGAAGAVGQAKDSVTGQLLQKPAWTTGDDGRFQFQIAAPEPGKEAAQLFLAQKGRAALARSIAFKTKKGTDPQDMQYEAEADLGDIVLPDGTQLFGRVRDDGGKPVANVRIVANDVCEHGQFLPGQHFGFFCAATSDATGIFSLPCALPQAVQLEFSAPGYYHRTLRPVANGTPLEMTLQKGGFIAGRVLDKDGKGVAKANVYVAYEMRGFTENCLTEGDGSFRVNLSYPTRYRISAMVQRGDSKATAAARARGRMRNTPWDNAHSDVLQGPRENLELQLKADDGKGEEKKDEPLTVRAIDKGTRQPVTEFVACSLWEEYANRNPNYLEYRMQYQLQSAKKAEDGKVDVPGPGQGASGTGAVRVLAKGYAPMTARDLEWKDLEAGKTREPLVVELVLESTIAGKVLDEVTGEPIADAKVWAHPKLDPSQGNYFDRSPSEPSDRAVTTAADGSFVLEQLGEGSWEVRAKHPKRPPLPAVDVELKAEQHLADFALKLPQGASVKGKLTGVPIGRGWKVFLHSVPPMNFSPNGGYYQNYNGQQVANNTVDVAADGTFAFDGVKLDSFFLVLTIPSAPRCGGDLFVPLEPMRVRKAGVQREFDLSADQPGQIKGRISFPAAAPSFDRLAVVAQMISEEGQMFWSPWMNQYPGPRSFVDQGGNFAIHLGPGQYVLQLIDIGTGIRLAGSDKPLKVEPNATVVADLAPKLYQLTVKLEKEDAGKDMALVDRIEVRVTPRQKNNNGAVMMGDNDQWESGVGVDLLPGETEARILVPDSQLHLLARNTVMSLRIDNERGNNQPLGKADIETSEQPEKNVLTLKVGPPPEIPPEKKKDEEGKEKQ
jgi:hypothetical protein